MTDSPTSNGRAEADAYAEMQRVLPPEISSTRVSERNAFMAGARFVLSRLAPEPSAALALVRKQAEDDGLWFQAATAPEAYLQQELRKLHAAVEGVTETKSVTDDFKRKTIEQMNEITGDGRPVEKPACRACKGTGRIETGTVVNGVAEVVACDCTPDETSEVSVRATPPTGRPPVTHGTPYAIEPGETAAHKPWCDSLRFIAGADVHLACNCRPVETRARPCSVCAGAAMSRVAGVCHHCAGTGVEPEAAVETGGSHGN